MIRLLPEQIDEIQQQIDLLTISLKKDVDLLKDNGRASGTGSQGFEYVPDFMSLEELGKTKEELSRLKSILNLAVVVSEYDNTKVNIGTRFTATFDFDGEMETEEYVLVEKNVAITTKSLKYISIESPLGKAVYNKTANDVFSYSIPRSSITVKGLINSISPSRLDSEISNKKSYCIEKN